MIKIYGIKNCSTVQKALKWLLENNIEHQFHDYKKDGIGEEKLKEFIKNFGWQKVLNSKGMTFRKLSDSEKPLNEIDAIALMKEKTSIIKRPIICEESIQLLGFDANEYKNGFIN
ncbi:MAG: Spx/MgsR family transcriptional regulator [Rickettsiales bacterium]|jgi:Spx/MgsR family transcriptional regulator